MGNIEMNEFDEYKSKLYQKLDTKFEEFDKKNSFNKMKREEFEKYLINKYSNLFEYWDEIKEYFDKGFNFQQIRKDWLGKGKRLPVIMFWTEFDSWWNNLLVFVFEQLKKILSDGIVSLIHIEQLKEKFWEMRVYLSYKKREDSKELKSLKEIEKDINFTNPFDIERYATYKSKLICEVCGKPGTLKSDGWLKTTCREHQ